MRRLPLPLVLVLALGGAFAPEVTAGQEAAAIGCLAAPATPAPAPVTVNEEIAVELEQLFRCVAAREWEGVGRFVAIPEGSVDPFAALRALDGTGLFTFGVTLESQVVRSSGPEGPLVDVAWRMAGQVRSERWSFRRRDGATGGGPWSLAAVEAGVPRYHGMIVGFSGAVGTEGVSLSRSEIVNPGGIELRLDVAPGVEPGGLLVVFPVDACDRLEPSPLAAFAHATGPAVTIALDDPPDGNYTIALVSTLAPISRDTICAAPSAPLRVMS